MFYDPHLFLILDRHAKNQKFSTASFSQLSRDGIFLLCRKAEGAENTFVQKQKKSNKNHIFEISASNLFRNGMLDVRIGRELGDLHFLRPSFESFFEPGKQVQIQEKKRFREVSR